MLNLILMSVAMCSVCKCFKIAESKMASESVVFK